MRKLFLNQYLRFMNKVVIIGHGNVASHLLNAFENVTTVEVNQINSRVLIDIPESDITVIAVSDDAIEEVSTMIKDRNGLIVHTSGSASLNTLSNFRKGVFYPLQSFTKNKTVDFLKVPFCLEVSNSNDYQLLESLVASIGAKSYDINSEQRKKLHLAAIFVNNFTNHMYTIGKDICDEHNVPFEILHALIEETANKVTLISPNEAQTGPAKRNDNQTIQSQLEHLNLQQQEIYKLITKSIQES